MLCCDCHFVVVYRITIIYFLSHYSPINLQVKLYTKQGAFKFKTECAPNNGYFLVAIYDKVSKVI